MPYTRFCNCRLDYDYVLHIVNFVILYYEHTAGVTGQQRMLTPPRHPILGGPCCPTLDFVIAFWIVIAFYKLLTSLFCIYSNFK